MLSAIVFSDPLNPRVRVSTSPDSKHYVLCSGNMDADRGGRAGPPPPGSDGSAVVRVPVQQSASVRFDSRSFSFFSRLQGTSEGRQGSGQVKSYIPNMARFGTKVAFGIWDFRGTWTLDLQGDFLFC